MPAFPIPVAERIDTGNLLAGERTLFSLSVPAEQVPEARLPETQRKVFDYWRSRRGQRLAPHRSDIDPCDLVYALPHLILWETDAPDYRIRLAGTEICRNFLGELRGTFLGQMRCPLIAEARTEFDAVRDRGMISVVERTLHWLDRPMAYYRHLLMPLANDAGRIHMLFSVMTFDVIDPPDHRPS